MLATRLAEGQQDYLAVAKPQMKSFGRRAVVIVLRLSQISLRIRVFSDAWPVRRDPEGRTGL